MMSPSRGARSTVFVVDNDSSTRDALSTLMRSVGLYAETFAIGDEFLYGGKSDNPGCLVLEVRLPGIGGLDLQRRLADARNRIPIIFLTAHGDVAMAVRAMKAGAVDFLTKPFRDQDVLDAIHMALERDQIRRERDATIAITRQRFAFLTTREQEVVRMVTSGMLNKQISVQMGISENTVKVHRSRAMHKMQARSLSDLVKIYGCLETAVVPSVFSLPSALFPVLIPGHETHVVRSMGENHA